MIVSGSLYIATLSICQIIYNDSIDKQNNEWDDNWDYYNDNLDMDQQSPEFWNF